MQNTIVFFFWGGGKWPLGKNIKRGIKKGGELHKKEGKRP